MQKPRPFKSLGEELTKLRLKAQESLAEVSGAVEIEGEALAQFENGEKRPSEDILMLLANHFNIEDNEADHLMDLAGYGQTNSGPTLMNDDFVQQPAMMILPMDARIVYTDVVNISVNNFGVVMSFMQNTLQNGQPLAVARVGMSIEHAKSVVKVLQATLDKAAEVKQIKLLPDSTKTSKKRNSLS